MTPVEIYSASSHIQKNEKEGLEQIFAHHIYSSIIHKGQKVKTTQMSLSR